MQFTSILILTLVSLTSTLLSEQLATKAPAGAPLFKLLAAEESGVKFINPIDEEHPLDFMYASGFASGSVTVADFNGDSKPDLFFSGCSVPNALYLQDGESGKLHFSQVTCGVESPKNWAAGAAAIDIDQDGDLDLYVANYDRPNELFINLGAIDGKLAFDEQAEEYGLNFSGAALVPSFADYDKDGDLDLFLLTNQLILEKTISELPTEFVNGKEVILKEWDRYLEIIQWPNKNATVEPCGNIDLLYKNNGKDKEGIVTFTDVTAEAGISGRTFGLSTLWFDYNNDGYPDIYIANDYDRPDVLWHNNGDGTFKSIHKEVFPYTSWASMGLAQADVDNNGFIDIVLPDMGGSTHFKSKTTMGVLTYERRHVMVNVLPHQAMRNSLLLNSGESKFTEAAYMAGIAKTDWTWSTKAGDFDNDGKIDLFFTNGISRNLSDSDNPVSRADYGKISVWDHYEKFPPAKESNRAFRNLGNLAFDSAEKNWGLDYYGMTYGAAMADLDLDGDLDLVTCNLTENVQILQNQQTENHGLVLQLKGGESNPHGVGAQITVESKSLGLQVRLLQPSAGFMSFDSHLIHFGMGKDKQATKVTVLWPDGKEQVVTGLKAGSLQTIVKGANAQVTKPSGEKSLFVASDKGPTFKHVENSFEDYDDFTRQPLLPIRLSRSGPGMAWCDVDQDGDEDVFFAGARYQAGELQINEGNGIFKTIKGPWSKDKDSEDSGVVWLDADQDGDLDLFVASGTPETYSGSGDLKDRLYINQGGLKFKKAKSSVIPSFRKASHTVSTVDYDRDGDLDLFIGSRSSLGRYPMAPESRILRNDGTKDGPKFVDSTSDVCSSLRRPGMITSSVWSDLDNNGWQDLVLAVDYGSIRVFYNNEGVLTEASEKSGLDGKLGWWNSVTTADLDGDGRMDIIAGNDGINTKYGKLKKGKTVHIHYGDMDNTGVAHIIESKKSPKESEILPVRGRG